MEEQDTSIVKRPDEKVSSIGTNRSSHLIATGVIVSFVILLASAIILIIAEQTSETRERYPTDNSSIQSTISTIPTSSAPGVTTNTSNANTASQQWETYAYTYEYINPTFSFSYPADWNFMYSDRAVEWDITLANIQGEEIQIDYSSFNDPYNTETDYLKYLDFWVKYGQEDNYSFTETIITDGKVNDISYKTYKVMASDSQFLVAILDVTNQQGRKGELGIRTKSLSEETLFWEMLNSVQHL